LGTSPNESASNLCRAHAVALRVLRYPHRIAAGSAGWLAFPRWPRLASPQGTSPAHDWLTTTAALFAWSGGDVVLFGERAGDRWVLARGWRGPDRLTDVRRWSFEAPERFVVQVRRLVREAVDDVAVAAAAATTADDWVAAVKRGTPGAS
jgi:hypothetical protein